MITYTSSLDGITPAQLQGFFVGWPNPPTPDTHLAILENSGEVVLAIDEGTGKVVGFINALTDRTLSAFIPLLEVLPAYQHQGIATRLVHILLERLQHYYSVDLLCDAELQPFYGRLGMLPANGMMLRRYLNQSGQGERRSGR